MRSQLSRRCSLGDGRIRFQTVLLLLILLIILIQALTTSFSDAFVLVGPALSSGGCPAATSSRPKSETTSLCAQSAKPSSRNNNNNNSNKKPAFAQTVHVSSGNITPGNNNNKNNNNDNNNHKPTRQFRGDSKVGALHEQRVKTAGRVGTKRYVNPCKVFVGNLPFSVTASDLERWICEQQGLPRAVLLNECKTITDWKTGQSKGYGFAVFTEAIYATVCIEKCNGLMWQGRAITVNQGVKKEQEQQLWLKKKKRKPIDQDEEAIAAAVQEAEEEERMDPEEIAMLRMLDPDLVPDSFKLDDDMDGSVPPIDEHGEPMNRQKRREIERKQKRLRKPQSKGFGLER